MNDQKLQYLIEIAKTGDGAAAAVRDLNQLDGAAKKTDQSFAAAAKQFKVFMAALAGAAIIKESIRAFEEQERAIIRLNGTLRNAGQYNEEYSRSLQKMASDLQNATKIADEEIINVQSVLIGFGAAANELPDITEKVLDLSAAGFDLNSSAQAMGAALQGNFSPLARMLKVDFAEGATRAQKLAEVLQVLETRFGGLARAQANLTGGLNDTKVQLGELKEKLGEFILVGIDPYVRAMNRAMAATADFLTGSDKSSQALVGQQVKLHNALEREIALRLENESITEEQAAEMRELIKLGMDAEQMYLNMKRVSVALRNGTDLGTSTPADGSRLLDIEAVQKQLELMTAQLQFAGQMSQFQQHFAGVSFNDPAMTNLEDLFSQQMGMLANSLEGGLLDQSHYDKLTQQIVQAHLTTLMKMGDEGVPIIQHLLDSEMSANDQVKAQINRNYDEMADKIEAFYAAKLFMATGNAEEEIKIEAQKQEMLKKLEEERAKATSMGYQMMQQAGQFAMQNFAQGFSSAFVAFISGTKSASEAFKQFAASFLQQVAQMIIQMLILRALQSVFGGGGVGAASGGVFPTRAAAGVAGVASIDQPTLFPNFNVLAGEAGREALTVLARPMMFNSGGISAVIGNAGANRLALMSANDFSALTAMRGPTRFAASGLSDIAGGLQRSGSGGAGGGTSEVMIRLEPGLKAEIVDESIEGAHLRIVNDLNQDSPVSNAVKGLTR